jgi:putative addiction module component (TIGR02574 family)
MSVAPEVLLEQALTLSAADRARLASGLLASLDDDAGVDAAEVERLWSEEAERRAAQVTSDEVSLTTWEHVTERIEQLRPRASSE